MSDNDPNVQEDETEAQASEAGHKTFESTVHREHVADRSGELLKAAVETAESLRRPNVVGAQDPRDGTKAHIVLLPGSVPKPLSPSVFDAYRRYPLDREGTAKLTRLDSFIDVVNRFKFPMTAVYARDDMKAPSLTAVFDYHPSNDLVDEMDDGVKLNPALNCKHRATYGFPLSDEWKAWTEKDGKPMSMPEFADFLEDRIVDVQADAKPSGEQAEAFVKAIGGNFASPSRLIELSRTLHVNENSTVRNSVKLSSGEGEVVFASEHTDANGDKLVIPNLFQIAIPVFARSSDYYRIIARLRYRKVGGGISFFYELWRLDLVFEDAFSEACAQVAEATECPIYYGAPESVEPPPPAYREDDH